MYTNNSKRIVYFTPPPWIYCDNPRPVEFNDNDSLFKVLLNYAVFFGRKSDDNKYIWDYQGLFCLRVGKDFYYMDMMPRFFKRCISDICDITKDEPLYIRYFIHKNVVTPQKFIIVRRKMSLLASNIQRVLMSHNQVLSKSGKL